MPDFLLVPLVASFARDDLGLRFRGQTPPAPIRAKIRLAIAEAIERRLVVEAGTDLAIGPLAEE
ncbi:MAG TPA: hypothetical protein VF516_39795, partial [Kofleriaceae bacterium]